MLYPADTNGKQFQPNRSIISMHNDQPLPPHILFGCGEEAVKEDEQYISLF
jgi:hypothetical protein